MKKHRLRNRLLLAAMVLLTIAGLGFFAACMVVSPKLSARELADLDHGARVALLLELHRRRAGAYPPGLQLSGEQVMDPYSEKPLIYRGGGGSYILYGIGKNGVDDGGDPSSDVVIHAAEDQGS